MTDIKRDKPPAFWQKKSPTVIAAEGLQEEEQYGSPSGGILGLGTGGLAAIITSLAGQPQYAAQAFQAGKKVGDLGEKYASGEDPGMEDLVGVIETATGQALEGVGEDKKDKKEEKGSKKKAPVEDEEVDKIVSFWGGSRGMA